MKKLLINLLALITTFVCHGQNTTRQMNENKDSFVNRIMSENSYKAGPTYEFKDSVSLILFFEIQALRKLPKKSNDMNHFEGVPTLTLLSVLYSEDQKEYRRIILDTLDINSGCCPCYYPATVDSVLHTNENEIIVLRTNPVKHDCNSMTTYWALLYSDLLEKIKSEKFSVKPSLTLCYYPFVGDLRKEILNQVKKEKQKN